MDIDFGPAFASAPAHNRIYGLVVAVVTNNKDPDKLGRVKLKFPWLSEDIESNWARIAAPMAGNQRGFFCLPEVDDEVLVGFEHGLIEFPYVVGALWNGKDKPPETNDDGKNNLRFIQSRSGHIIRLDDKDGAEKIEILDKSGKNTVVINAAENTITISADADITIQSANGKLVLSGKKGIELKSDDAVKIEATGDIEVKAKGKYALGGNGVELKSQAAVKIEANSTMDLKASGTATLKGATVNIN